MRSNASTSSARCNGSPAEVTWKQGSRPSTRSFFAVVQPRLQLSIPRRLWSRAGITEDDLIVCGLLTDGGLVVGPFGLVSEIDRWNIMTCRVDRDGIQLPRKALRHLGVRPLDTARLDIGAHHFEVWAEGSRLNSSAASVRDVRGRK